MLPSLKVPVAMNCCVEPTDSVGVAGVTVIDTNPVGVRVPGRYNSALATPRLPMALPPATSTFPSFSNVAVWEIAGAGHTTRGGEGSATHCDPLFNVPCERHLLMDRVVKECPSPGNIGGIWKFGLSWHIWCRAQLSTVYL